LLDTFELVGYLVKSNSLEVRDAWVNFSAWAISWWQVFAPEIERLRSEDRTIYEDYDWLVDQFLDIEAGERGLAREDLVPTRRRSATSSGQRPGPWTDPGMRDPWSSERASGWSGCGGGGGRRVSERALDGGAALGLDRSY
jgi:hypothetical protein